MTILSPKEILVPKKKRRSGLRPSNGMHENNFNEIIFLDVFETF